MNFLNITKVEKKGATVTITLENAVRPIVYDMAENKLTSYTGRAVKTFPRGCIYYASDCGNIDKLIVDALVYPDRKSVLSNLERYLSTPELLINITSARYVPNECPAGFIKWLKAHEYSLSNERLEQFLEEKKIEQFPKEDKEVLELLTKGERCPFTYRYKKIYVDSTSEARHKFNKILKLSMKEFSWDMGSRIQTFIERVYNERNFSYNRARPENWIELLDTNRNFEYNIKLIEAATIDIFNETIAKRQTAISDIEKLSNDYLTVVVPKNVEDLILEGNQQHNCVGHYYNRSICEGRNLIYFIRKTATPDKSYITNRYNIGSESTVESRAACNTSYHDTEVIKLIHEIDIAITAILSGEKAE